MIKEERKTRYKQDDLIKISRGKQDVKSIRKEAKNKQENKKGMFMFWKK